ncbi:MAG: saccharopine dehydrogenase NADP-binding domain-containing protein [Acidobacteria bacterium]|nr:saccharopine dehydrogenase NADP-binding domain-containing protein [Acidobacteriota bacterium]
MSYAYAVIGAGRQGVAAAYDLGKFGDASRVLLVDANLEIATAAAATVNRLLDRSIAQAAQCDATNLAMLRSVLHGTDAILSAAHYNLNLGLTELAVSIKAHLCDLGGHTGVVRQQHAFDGEAKRAGITVAPDCGMGPGLNVSLAAYVMEKLDRPREVLIWDGGLPQDPQPPWNYVCTFAMSGLTNEYAGSAYFLRHGEVTEVPCLTDREELEFAPPVGRLEAFVTSGGLSTAPWTWKGTLDRLENKTMRYVGHCALLRAYDQLGLFSLNPIEAGGVTVVPREVLHALLEPRIGARGAAVRDICVMRVTGRGDLAGQPSEVTVELIDRYDEATGFTAMQRLTGWHAAIVLGLAVRGQLTPGVRSVESIPGSLIVSEGRRRGWVFNESIRPAM